MPLVAVVVDDSMLIRYTVGRFLEDRGYTVESAADGAEALEVLKRVRPDLVVTDMQMPKMSGGELIAFLKGDPRTAEVPIIVVAATPDGSVEGEQRANFTIRKDIDIETQLGKALDVLKGKRTAAKAARK